MKDRLLIIPAKGFSKRIKEKNIKNFFGKPIISYALKIAYNSKLFKKIHVSTESKKVQKIVENLGYKIDFLRPKKLAKSDTPTIDVLRYVYHQYKELKYKFDEIWTLSCCTPLLTKKDLQRASKYTKKKKILLAVTKFGTPIEWAFQLKKNNSLKPISPNKLLKSSQSFTEKYHDSGAFAVFPTRYITKKNFKMENNFVGYVLPRERAVDIDNLDDWRFAELLYKNNTLLINEKKNKNNF